MPVQKLKNYLDENKIKYVSIKHSPAYTAQEIAASAHIPGKEIAKSVVVKVDGKITLTVIPGSYQLDLNKLKAVTNADEVRIAHEQEFKDKFPDCEVGAMPPFGNLYDLDTFVAKTLTEDETISFNACSHTELIQLDCKDYLKLVNPKIEEIAYLSKL